MVAFLASDLARLITAADFRIDGGAGAKHWRYMPNDGMEGPLPLESLDRTEV